LKWCEAATPEILLFATTTADTRLAIGDLPPGQLRILLRAVDAQGVEGIDASADFELSDQPPPPLTVAPLHGQTINSDRPLPLEPGPRCAQQRAADRG
jgi:predicted phage tail protein